MDMNIGATTGRRRTLQPAHGLGLALGTVHLLVLPIDALTQMFNPVAAFDLGLPALIRPCGATEDDPVVLSDS